MRYHLAPIPCRPWLLNSLSPRLIESHYENNYGGAVRRLNAITEKLESIDFASTPAYELNSLKREELVALNSSLLHELYFACLGGDGKNTESMLAILARISAPRRAGGTSSPRWDARSGAARGGCCSATCRAIAGS